MRESVEGMGGGGGENFKYFGQRGVIIQGRRLTKGLLLFEEIQYVYLHYRFSLCYPPKRKKTPKW